MEPDIEQTRAAKKPAPWVEHEAPDLENTVITGIVKSSELGVPTHPLDVSDLTDTSPPQLQEPALVSAAEAGASTLPSYSFRIGFDSEPVSLDTVVFIGRKPTPPRISQSEPRRLVSVESPKQEVSSTHLELRQRGSSVIATDLRSTNGTTVVIPGATPRRMRQGESVVVTPGTFIDIGDGNLIEILASRLRYTPGGEL